MLEKNTHFFKDAVDCCSIFNVFEEKGFYSLVYQGWEPSDHLMRPAGTYRNFYASHIVSIESGKIFANFPTITV